MNKKRILSFIILLTMIASSLSGCGLVMPENTEEVSESTSEYELTTLGMTPDLDYDKPKSKTHIEIDQLGYLPEQKKMAIFRGDNLSGTFNVVSADTLDVVYSGKIETKAVSGNDESYSYGLFTEYEIPGEYYIQTDVIGYSYKFTISDEIYDGLLSNALKQFYYNRCGYSLASEYAGENARNACHIDPISLKQDAGVSLDVIGGWHMNPAYDRIVSKGCDSIETLLMAYEYNTEAFGDDEGIPESGDGIPDILNEIVIETDWLLKMQEPSTGAVYESVSTVDNGKGINNPSHIEDLDLSATLSFASALGYFSYLYQNYDNAYATKCLQAADRAMKYVAKSKDTLSKNEYFRAATMMYRATGYIYYRNIIDEYMASGVNLDMSDNVVFNGCVTYLATRQKTNKEYCATMMKSLKDYAIDLSENRGDYLYLMGAEKSPVEHNALLAEIARLSVVNYMISSNEYETLMEKYLHYFFGCNPDNICYVGQYGSDNITETQAASDILKQPETDAYYVLLLSGILSE